LTNETKEKQKKCKRKKKRKEQRKKERMVEKKGKDIFYRDRRCTLIDGEMKNRHMRRRRRTEIEKEKRRP